MLLDRAVKTTFEEEARTSALLAARLIATNGFTVSDPSVRPLIAAPTGKPAPRPTSQTVIQTGNYDVELLSAKYDWIGAHAVQLEFMIEESYGIWNSDACGQTFSTLYVFRTPYPDILLQFVRASVVDLFGIAITDSSVKSFCEFIKGSKYGVTIERKPWLKPETTIINYIPYGSNGNFTRRR